jgi:non-specific protein-tyrosine kinase
MQQDITIDLKDLFRFLRRGLLLALLVAGAAAAFAYYRSSNEEPIYRTRATVSISHSAPDLRQFGISPVTAAPLDAGAYRIAAFSDPVLDTALANLNDTTGMSMSKARLRSGVMIRIEEMRNSSLLHFDVEDLSPTVAAARANALALALVEWDRQRAGQRLTQGIEILSSQIGALSEEIRSLQVAGAPQDQIDGLIRQRAELQQSLNNARTLNTAVMGRLDVLQPAPPGGMVSQNVVLNTALAFVLGLVVIYGLLLLRAALDTRLRSVDDLANATGLPVLAEFPKIPKNTRRLPAEASSYLRTNLLFATSDADPKVIMVTSAQMSEGKSSVALSLAESFARNDYKTLLVDADLRKPVIGQEYHLDEKRYASLKHHLENLHERFEPARIAINLTQYLDVVPSFKSPAAPTELLGRYFRDWLDAWKRDYDVIIIDSAPLLAVADSLTIAPLCTGTVLVASQQATDRRQVRTAVELLQRLGVRILGVTATHVDEATSQRGMLYGYGYGGPAQTPTPVVSRRTARAPRKERQTP